ncbi:4-hydroxythreonine-4-phosphate dehydrogenase PdxA [Luteolibacter flavescens]|uniref:4-hydroxythreonine-4-phosphate dehydrogenase PdxA n=1 Tax=Luteolibacter flavescens TaxID=1859460 RepID=A0ABT3FQP4_9BACT|nr:4-hydroxythreonine-4-phosphate dehydrogenase PdxA [Luteolibacter flavescens]MCW1885897.1 4-hydroxythreonine-4-phosphate dehydrogenase PdxA [Luteolibacter flavescens]
MPRILITLGDPAGIGPEVVEKALASGQLPKGFDFEVLGDASGINPGKPDEESARRALDALEASVRILKSDSDALAVVTAPVSKATLQAGGFPFPGQTEFFAHRFDINEYAMCLSGQRLSVGLATIHIPLASVSSSLSVESIVSVGGLLEDFARRRARRTPRIAVAGLNPHAGENGRFGDEEDRIISPAIDRLNQTFPGVFSGPHVPDAIFRQAAEGEFDAVLAMYHDQGLIPLKLLDFDTGVNVTLGLPKPRTSPDHGTAFGIAGKGIARPDSMIHAIKLACELA